MGKLFCMDLFLSGGEGEQLVLHVYHIIIAHNNSLSREKHKKQHQNVNPPLDSWEDTVPRCRNS